MIGWQEGLKGALLLHPPAAKVGLHPAEVQNDVSHVTGDPHAGVLPRVFCSARSFCFLSMTHACAARTPGKGNIPPRPMHHSPISAIVRFLSISRGGGTSGGRGVPHLLAGQSRCRLQLGNKRAQNPRDAKRFLIACTSLVFSSLKMVWARYARHARASPKQNTH